MCLFFYCTVSASNRPPLVDTSSKISDDTNLHGTHTVNDGASTSKQDQTVQKSDTNKSDCTGTRYDAFIEGLLNKL